MSDSLLRRVLSAVRGDPAPMIERPDGPISLLKSANPGEIKSSVGLLPQGAYGPVYEFFSADGGRTFVEGAQLSGTVLAFVAYWYVATRWRAQKIAEPPLMVVKEDQKDGSEEWISNHELVSVLEQPSDDYDMGELLERTSIYLDNTSECIWVMDRNRLGVIARLTPFKKGEFTVRSSSKRLYQTFRVNTSSGPQEFDASAVCYFRDSHEGWNNDAGKSRLDVAMAWLRLGETARQTIRDLLGNAMWPSAVVIPDKEWNPDTKVLAQYKQDLENYARPGQRGKPFVQLGGGTFQSLAATIRDLVPTDVLNRVESVVAAISGVPAIVLQFQIGLENSPWSQMEQARKMAYEDTIIPSWRKIERVTTRQMLRSVDEDATHFIRFDRTQVQSLQEDQLEAAQIATLWGRAASLNERRQRMGLEPSDDPKADEIPELTQPSMEQLLANNASNSNSSNPSNDTPPSDTPTPDKKPDKKPKASDKAAMYQWCLAHKAESFNLTQVLRNEASTTWELMYHQLLQKDRDEIADIVRTLLTDAVHKSVESKARGKDSALRAVSDYLAKESNRLWMRTVQPAFIKGAERAVAVASADSGVRYTVMHPFALKFAQKNAAQSISEVSKTTKRLVHDIISAGLEENRSTAEIAQLIHEATGFSKARARLIARTESTTIFSGAPVEALSAYSKSSDRVFFKTWFGVMDEKERDEHVAMEGETVLIDEPFSNGLLYPSEPNCRCHVITHEGVDA